MRRNQRASTLRTIVGLAFVLGTGALAGLLGCRNDIAAPTQGFIAVEADGVTGVEVFVDGESYGTTGRVGPLDAGTYTVNVAKAFYDVAPGAVEVAVVPGRTVTAAFDLLLVATGSLAVTATDELLGGAVTGAEILVDTGTGFAATGVTAPGTIADLAPGPLRLLLRRVGFEDTPTDATVEAFETTDVDVVMGPPRAVLGEMFTFISCAGCPESAAELDEIRHSMPDRFYVIEWHSQAPFPLYDPRWEDRQDFYTGGSLLPKPGVLFQGGATDSPQILIGSASAELAEYHARTDAYLAACDTDCPVALKVVGEISGVGADFDVRVRWRGGALPGGLFLHVVLQENHVVSQGNQPWFDYVPRDLDERTVSFSTPGEILRFEGSFPVEPTWVVDELALVAYVQSSVSGEILAVGGR